jgi:hypothetical protein
MQVLRGAKQRTAGSLSAVAGCQATPYSLKPLSSPLCWTASALNKFGLGARGRHLLLLHLYAKVRAMLGQL